MKLSTSKGYSIYTGLTPHSIVRLPAGLWRAGFRHAQGCWLIALALVISLPLSAHEVRPALLTITQQDEFSYRAVFKQPQVQGRFLNLGLVTNCEAALTDARTSSAALQESFLLTCTEPLASIEIDGLKNTLIDTMITIEDLEGKRQNYLVTGREPRIDTASGTSTPIYFILGMEHLFFGIDHVLFVLLLLYLVTGFGNLVKVVTSFTVAHSITLGLSAFNIVSVSQAPVEALIALSIVLLATEALKDGGAPSAGFSSGMLHRNPWIITFVFGLLHGLGFAGALAEIGLPQGAAAMALFLFNVGIEVGQLLIIAISLAAAWAIVRVGLKPGPLVLTIPVYAIGAVSSYWFIDRTLQVLA